MNVLIEKRVSVRGIIINEVGSIQNEMQSTAIDDYNIRHVNDDEMILHMFQHRGINMGLDDVKMPGFSKGLAYYETVGEPVIIRNSGGRSIVADEGVLSMSLIFRSSQSMYDNYDYYGQFIMDALQPIVTGINIGEISGACCPGKTDMSINGKKFCGTAQRKIKDGVALVCYIHINGDQMRRNQIVKGFYEACESEEIKIDLDAMDSLSNLVGREIAVSEVVTLLENELKKRTESVTYESSIPSREDFHLSVARTQNQNDRYLKEKEA